MNAHFRQIHSEYPLILSLHRSFIITFGSSWLEVGGIQYRMLLALSFVLIGFLIWIAENTAIFFGAWEYPNQADAWSLVYLGKVSSWLLLVIVSFLIVATLKQVKGKNSAEGVSGHNL